MLVSDLIRWPYTYNNFPDQDARMDLIREITDSQQFFQQVVGCPSDTIAFGARETRRINVSLEPRSFVTEIRATSTNNAGFMFSIYDVGGKISLSTSAYMLNSHWGAYEVDPEAEENGLAIPSPPLVVITPGIWTVIITNLATVSANIQLAIKLAVPLNRASGGNVLEVQTQ